MPVRFQVDPDFYDHPKSIGLSDAATALWTRAGSYSAAKLTDGFLAEHVLATLSTSPEEAAAELVARGLWRRRRGGYQFHQWSDRNLTKAIVTAKQKSDRDRKRKDRHTSDQNTNPQVNPQIVRAESSGSPPGVPVESGASPPPVVSVSVSSTTRTLTHLPAPGTEADAREEPAGPPGIVEALLAEHIDAAGGKVNARAVAELGQHVAELVHAGRTPDEIRAGFALWRSRGVRPSSLPDLVDYAARNGAGTTTARGSPRPGNPYLDDLRAQGALPQLEAR